jgi:hypothetical protein
MQDQTNCLEISSNLSIVTQMNVVLKDTGSAPQDCDLLLLIKDKPIQHQSPITSIITAPPWQTRTTPPPKQDTTSYSPHHQSTAHPKTHPRHRGKTHN